MLVEGVVFEGIMVIHDNGRIERPVDSEGNRPPNIVIETNVQRGAYESESYTMIESRKIKSGLGRRGMHNSINA